MLIKQSADHLRQNNMTYWQHLCFAAGHGVRCIWAGFLLVIHSIAPCFFPQTGSFLVHKLSRDFSDHILRRLKDE